eukprot:c19525_g1_i2.p1 GENE.c19525_g1_i2~~c19525_g1_i2.p1  ORF type:complete len:261 (+),score=48.99 c19525_g1_i2:99-785(+)
MCDHGTMILFERFSAKESGSSRKFFACSFSRDRKLCRAFCWAEDVGKKRSKLARHNGAKSEPFSPVMCTNCSLVVDKSDSAHKDHVTRALTGEERAAPSRILRPLDVDKQNAQYLFTPSHISYLVDVLVTLGVRRVACVGTPSIHEAILQRGATPPVRSKQRKSKGSKKDVPLEHAGASDTTLTSLLLDMDDRYRSFFPTTFSRFNMFNAFFFLESVRQSVPFGFQRL